MRGQSPNKIELRRRPHRLAAEQTESERRDGRPPGARDHLGGAGLQRVVDEVIAEPERHHRRYERANSQN